MLRRGNLEAGPGRPAIGMPLNLTGSLAVSVITGGGLREKHILTKDIIDVDGGLALEDVNPLLQIAYWRVIVWPGHHKVPQRIIAQQGTQGSTYPVQEVPGLLTRLVLDMLELLWVWCALGDDVDTKGLPHLLCNLHEGHVLKGPSLSVYTGLGSPGSRALALDQDGVVGGVIGHLPDIYQTSDGHLAT